MWRPFTQAQFDIMMSSNTTKNSLVSALQHLIAGVSYHVLASVLIAGIGACAFLFGFAKSEHFEDLSNWPVWLAIFGAIVAILFSLNLIRLIAHWLSRKRIRAGSGNTIAIMIASISAPKKMFHLNGLVRWTILAR
jgi:hypothetical protein